MRKFCVFSVLFGFLLAFGTVQAAYGGGALDSVLGGGSGPAQPDTTASSDEVGASGVQDSALPDVVTTTSRPDQKTLTVSGLPDKPGRVTCFIFDYKNEETVAIGYLVRKASDSTVTFPLLDYNTNPQEPWTGRGSYSIELWFDWDGSIFAYTDGKTWPQLGIYSVDDRPKQPLYSFSSVASTIAFSRFRDQLEWHKH